MSRWLLLFLLLSIVAAVAILVLDERAIESQAPAAEAPARLALTNNDGRLAIGADAELPFRDDLVELVAALETGTAIATPVRVDIKGIAPSGEHWTAAVDQFNERLPAGVELDAQVFVVDAAADIDQICSAMFEAAIRDPVRFDLSGESIRTASYATLDRIVEYAGDCRQSTIVITGHSDSLGDEAFNLALSERRARAVADFLVARGVAATRLDVRGVGSTEPIADNSTRHGRVQNRRIEFTWRPRD